MRIPKIIHFCWLSSDDYPKDIQKYMQSWKNILTDYEFVHWNLNRDKIGENVWVKQAFEAKKYAFAADYIRIYALYKYGGIYLDTDVEVVKKFDDLLHLPYFAGTEGGKWIEAGVFGAEKGADWLKDILIYFDKPFHKKDGVFDMITLPQIMNRIVEKKRMVVVAEKEKIIELININYHSHFYLFPKEYFSPKDMGTGILEMTVETYAIHHFAMSWIPAKKKLIPNIKRTLMKVFGVENIYLIISIFGLKKRL